MCGRFTLTRKDFRQLAAELGAEFDDSVVALYRPRYNIAPTDQHWIVRMKQEEHQLLPAKFGLVNSWAPDMKGAARQINAKSETADNRPAFRDAFESRRCAIPADGFFEWAGTKEARRPYWYHAPDGGMLLFAGLYESWRDPKTDKWTRTFAILTTDANEVVAPVHDRMPVILPPDRVDDWIFRPADKAKVDKQALRQLLRPAPNDAIVATEVSRRVNAVANDDEACLAAAGDREDVASPRLL
ncbi:MAG: SOS response-associated peptidase [Dehalococcoidia bacterium]